MLQGKTLHKTPYLWSHHLCTDIFLYWWVSVPTGWPGFVPGSECSCWAQQRVQSVRVFLGFPLFVRGGLLWQLCFCWAVITNPVLLQGYLSVICRSVNKSAFTAVSWSPRAGLGLEPAGISPPSFPSKQEIPDFFPWRWREEKSLWSWQEMPSFSYSLQVKPKLLLPGLLEGLLGRDELIQEEIEPLLLSWSCCPSLVWLQMKLWHEYIQSCAPWGCHWKCSRVGHQLFKFLVWCFQMLYSISVKSHILYFNRSVQYVSMHLAFQQDKLNFYKIKPIPHLALKWS